MASQGMVRADLTDLASLDSISTGPTVTSTNGSMPRGKGEIEELKTPVDYLDLHENNDWEMDMSQVRSRSLGQKREEKNVGRERNLTLV